MLSIRLSKLLLKIVIIWHCLIHRLIVGPETITTLISSLIAVFARATSLVILNLLSIKAGPRISNCVIIFIGLLSVKPNFLLLLKSWFLILCEIGALYKVILIFFKLLSSNFITSIALSILNLKVIS